MTATVTRISSGELKREIQEIRAAGKAIRHSKQSARDFLVKHGFVTKSGRLTKRYGG
jgi:hypothetical protein